MKSTKKYPNGALRTVFIGAALMLLGSLASTGSALALAGWAENFHQEHYNERFNLEYNYPSDGCPRQFGDQYCLQIIDLDNPYATDFEELLSINQPVPGTQHFIGQSYRTGEWLIYDTNSQELFRGSKDQALLFWGSLEYVESPEFIYSRRGMTWLEENLLLAGFLLAPIIGLAILGGMVHGGIILIRKLRK